MVNQRSERAEKKTRDRVALAPRPAGVTPIPPESSSAIDIQNKNLKGTLWLLHEILDNYLRDDGHLELLLNWVPIMRLHWILATMCRKKRLSGILVVCVLQYGTGASSHPM